MNPEIQDLLDEINKLPKDQRDELLNIGTQGPMRPYLRPILGKVLSMTRDEHKACIASLEKELDELAHCKAIMGLVRAYERAMQERFQ